MPSPPQAGESQNDFHSRCMEAVQGEYKDQAQRNAVCYSMWKEHKEKHDAAEEYADKALPVDKFVKVPDVAIFAEHETIDKEGNPQKYGLQEVAQIANNLNNRVLGGTFSKLVDGHTPEPHEKHLPQPEVKGYYGAARVGKLPDGRMGIFVDEYREKGQDDYFLKHPGRSVEMWMYPDKAKRIFDPIAALGAVKARLDLPMTFSESPEHIPLVRYSAKAVDSIVKYGDAGAAVAPGPTSSYIPPHAKKERYETMLTPEMVEEIKAIVMQCMQTPAAPPPPAAAPPAGGPPGQGGKYEEEEKEKKDDEEHDHFEKEGEGKEKEKMSDKERLMADCAKMSSVIAEQKVQIAKYQRLDTEVDRLKADNKNAERYAALVALEREGYIFRPTERKLADGTVVKMSGIEREMERCRYGAMSDEQFNEHRVVIVENYSKAEIGVTLYVPGGMPYVPAPAALDESQKQLEDVSLEARKRTEKYRAEGKKMPYVDVLNEVRKEKNLAQH